MAKTVSKLADVQVIIDMSSSFVSQISHIWKMRLRDFYYQKMSVQLQILTKFGPLTHSVKGLKIVVVAQMCKMQTWNLIFFVVSRHKILVLSIQNWFVEFLRIQNSLREKSARSTVKVFNTNPKFQTLAWCFPHKTPWKSKSYHVVA